MSTSTITITVGGAVKPPPPVELDPDTALFELVELSYRQGLGGPIGMDACACSNGSCGGASCGGGCKSSCSFETEFVS